MVSQDGDHFRQIEDRLSPQSTYAPEVLIKVKKEKKTISSFHFLPFAAVCIIPQLATGGLQQLGKKSVPSPHTHT